MKNLFIIIMFVCFTIGCKTVDLEEVQLQEVNESIIEENKEDSKTEEFVVQEELVTQDVESTIVYVDRPVYIPYEERNKIEEKKHGIDAVKESLSKATVEPKNYNKGTFYYTYDENLVYEVYAQPYHLTDIILEEGEIVMGNPLVSEDDSVWELTANVATNPKTGGQIQHLFIKPAYSNQDSTMIIITDRRVYHFRIKSFNTTHMAKVKFNYPNKNNVWATPKRTNDTQVENEYVSITNPEFLSFDYKMKYKNNDIEFLPKRVYDDGSKTYIVVDEKVLHKELPLIFNEKNEIVNYQVQKNIFIIPRLINKVTLRLGKQKVIVEKKKQEVKVSEDIEESSNEIIE